MSNAKSAAEMIYDADQAQDTPGVARIELWFSPIAYHGHAFLKRINADGTTEELHGEPTSFVDGSELRAEHYNRDSKYTRGGRRVAVLASGSEEQIARTWAKGMAAREEINAGKKGFQYKAYDVAYEGGGSGGEIQNSNSMAFTYVKAMDLDAEGAIRKAGIDRRLPGWGRNLRDPNYRRYMSPPPLAVTQTP